MLRLLAARWPRLARMPLLVASGFFASGCGSQVCPALDVVSRDPLWLIRSVRHGQSGAAVPQVTLSDIVILGGRQTAADMQFFAKHQLSRNISADGDRLICTVECTFGGEQGPWEFTISAPGFRDKRVSYDMQYSGREYDRCTMYFVGSFPVDITLEPAP